MLIKLISFNYHDLNFKYAKSIRQLVFIEEQSVDVEEEFDEFDKIAKHYLVFVNQIPIATARYRNTEEGIRLERFAVLRDYRRLAIGHLLIRYILQNLHYKKQAIYLHAQTYVIKFYESNGFIKTGKQFIEAKIPHYKMIYSK